MKVKTSINLRVVALATVAALGLSACGGGSGNNFTSLLTPAPTKNIVQVAQGDQRFSILVEAVVAANLADTLSGTGPFTVFAPTNEAFAAALTELGVTKEQLFANKQLLTTVLTYHVVPAKVAKSAVPINAPIATVQGQTFTVGADLKITDANGRKAAIVLTDINATNGIIHAIDKVILPK